MQMLASPLESMHLSVRLGVARIASKRERSEYKLWKAITLSRA